MSYANYKSWPVPEWKDYGVRIPGSRHDFRWRNMRHTLCMNHQHGKCQHSDYECNRAHGPEFLEKPAYTDEYKKDRKTEEKGKGKKPSPRNQPYPSDKGKSKEKKGKGKSK